MERLITDIGGLDIATTAIIILDLLWMLSMAPSLAIAIENFSAVSIGNQYYST